MKDLHFTRGDRRDPLPVCSKVLLTAPRSLLHAASRRLRVKRASYFS
jgi:hypothetical protein